MTASQISDSVALCPLLFQMAYNPYQQSAHEARGRWVGPYPISDFSDLLSPSKGLEPCPAPPKNIFDSIPNGPLEKDMYPELVKALESLKLKGLDFVNMSVHADNNAPPHKKLKPDISAYGVRVRVGAVPIDPSYTNTKKPKTPSPTHFSHPLLSFELRWGKHDPFCDKPPNPDDPFEMFHVETQGQIAATLNEMLSYSFRTHAYSVFMDGYIARLFRADRSGIIVSEAFDYCAHPHYLTNFLRHFSNAEPEHKGVDVTVTRNPEGVQIQIPGSLPMATFELEGEPPHAESLISRARRAVKVTNVNSGVSCFMKDGWRADLKEVKPEQDIIAELHRHGVPHIPTILTGGDIQEEYHCTLANTLAESEWRVGPKTKLTPQVHYRFIEEDAGKPLEEFTDARELTQALADVVEALGAAWERCRYLHRDVSSANIMIDPGGRGILIDWELAKQVSEGEPQEPGRGCDRTGTWAYMSAAILYHLGKPHSLLDDLQSVYWVAFESGLNYLSNDYEYLATAAECLVEYNPKRGPHGGGGNAKGNFLRDSPMINFLGNPAFSTLMSEFCTMMDSADSWERKLIQRGPSGAGPVPTNVPDHDRVLGIFRVALNSPEWASEERGTTPLVWKEASQYLPGAMTRSRSTTSQKHPEPPGYTSEIRHSKRSKTGASASSNLND